MPKMKISISLEPGVIAAVDRSANARGETRSAVIERWLQEASRRDRTMRLEADTAAYYEALSVAEREEDAAWAGASSAAYRRLAIDVRQRGPIRRRARRG